MSDVLLIQPDAGGRVSGGYLYNARMAEGGAWRLLDVTADALPETIAEIKARPPAERPKVVLADSIWLTEAALTPFLTLAESGIGTGVMMHSFPSMIAAAEGGDAIRTEPTAFEYRAVETLGKMVVPGRHYAEMLTGRDVRIIEASPGIDDQWRLAPRRRQGPCRLVSVGAVTPRKGFLDLAEVLYERVRAGTDRPDGSEISSFSWTIIGSLDVDPAYAARVRERINEINRLSGSERIVFAGQCTPTDTRTHVQQADVLVMPSYDENQPLVLLEAIAASVPAVAYAAGAAERMLGYGKAGLVGAIGNRAQLAAHVIALIESESKRFELAEGCWQMQAELPNWSQSAASVRSALLADYAS